MTVQGIVEQIYSLMSKDWSKVHQEETNSMSNSLDYLSNCLMLEIDKEESTNSLESIIHFENEHFFLPIPTVIKLYQRLILLSQTNKSYYEGLVDYLSLYGPDWEEEANTITRLIDSANFEEAKDYVQNIEYFKEFN